MRERGGSYAYRCPAHMRNGQTNRAARVHARRLERWLQPLQRLQPLQSAVGKCQLDIGSWKEILPTMTHKQFGRREARA